MSGKLFLAGILTVTASVMWPMGIPAASAADCPDVEVVFARGTFEPPGVGGIGQAFVDQLKAEPLLGGKSVDVYAVNYPASLNFPAAADGVIDASNRVQDMAVRCPSTKIVLGGYSQGAAVAGYVTADKIPDGYVPPNGINGPMPAEVARHVAAVALFGKPSNGFLNSIDRSAPPITVGALYGPKTIDQCIAEDPICSPTGGDNGAHGAYADNGMTAQAATFAAQKVVTATAAAGAAAPNTASR
ncbi:cutinase [Mycolicibacterium sp. BK556]|uniref:cutinase family protein n=1 Tax=Mycobacteriaceae TaxID=1762 RepID=UPI00105F9C44|nr:MULTISPECIES: cutinase family protein [Mycobacteriaceae]MBB3601684.1 cutinase [Mycolicibacterium sp. BK556]MBB3631436.1 cutinase [Mycolicibacterium sp. BK607]MBB3749440.1 cutinase [Mycolicibacterium sp. BK634]TDO14341.1 cutinase [Mycobacterium sp. BK086]